MSWTICTDSFEFSNGTIGTPVPFPTSYLSYGALQLADFVSGGSSPFVVNKPTTGEWIIGPDSEGSYLSINVTGYGDGSWGHVTIEGVITFWHEPTRRSMSLNLGFNGSNGNSLGVGIYYDEENEKAGMIKFEGDSSGGYVEGITSDPGYPNTAKHFYNFLKANVYTPPTLSLIIDYQAQISHYHRRFVTENSILYNNTNSNKYVTYTYSGTTYKIYNSAIYYDQTNNAVYFMLLLNEYGEMLSQYENSPNEWRTGSNNYLHNSTNGVYYGNFYYNNAGFIYYNGISSSTLNYINDYGLPFFTDKEKYMDYICSIYIPVTVRVSYVIPNDDYKYCKLTWKKDEMPTSVNDGTSATILKDEPTVDVIGLEEGANYWFTIYTNKSESPPFPFTVPINSILPQYRTFIDNINGSGFDWIRAIQQDTATITNSDHSTFTSNMYKYYPMNKVTWYTYHHQGTDVESWNKTTFGELTTALFVSSKIDKVEINSNNGVYSCTITKNNQNTERDPNRMFVYDKTITMGGVYTDATLPRSWYANFYGHSNYLACTNCNPFYLAGSWSTRTFSGTLTEVFTQLQRYVRNIDIYVDGKLWSKGGK